MATPTAACHMADWLALADWCPCVRRHTARRPAWSRRCEGPGAAAGLVRTHAWRYNLGWYRTLVTSCAGPMLLHVGWAGPSLRALAACNRGERFRRAKNKNREKQKIAGFTSRVPVPGARPTTAAASAASDAGMSATRRTPQSRVWLAINALCCLLLTAGGHMGGDAVPVLDSQALLLRFQEPSVKSIKISCSARIKLGAEWALSVPLELGRNVTVEVGVFALHGLHGLGPVPAPLAVPFLTPTGVLLLLKGPVPGPLMAVPERAMLLAGGVGRLEKWGARAARATGKRHGGSPLEPLFFEPFVP
jgi:hypothetical protein